MPKNKRRKEVKLMPIKWSAVKVSEVMDEIEEELKDIDEGLNACLIRTSKAKTIPNLPEYMKQRLNRLGWEIERALNIGDSIEAVRNAIPEGATEAEQGRSKYGNTQSLM